MRLKCLLRKKENIFWSLLFPIILGTFFSIAFANLYSDEKFQSIPIAIIQNEAYEKDTAFAAVIKSVDSSDDGNKLFKVTEGSKEELEELLEKGDVVGYIDVEDNYSFTVNDSSISQSIAVSFLESYKGNANIIASVLSKDPSKVMDVTKELMNSNEYVKEEIKSANEPDTTVNYFYALIAMACLYACDWGLMEISAIQANQSVQGARINVAPVHKMKLLLCNLLAACTIQISCILIILAYLIGALGVDFGDQIPYVVITAIIGSVAGLLLGAMVSSIITKNKNLKETILRVVALGGSFLAGLMIVQMKYIVAQNAPILKYINPAALITDALFSLYYYDTHTRFYINIGLLLILSVIFAVITYLQTRRKEYASI
jgi:ABC-2 type transport system permease protein